MPGFKPWGFALNLQTIGLRGLTCCAEKGLHFWAEVDLQPRRLLLPLGLPA